MNPQKNKGDKAEREVAALLSELTGKTVRRKLGAGRTNSAGGDTGDIEGLPNWAIQVCDWKDKSAACLQKPTEAEDGIRDRSPSRGLGDVYKRQYLPYLHPPN